MGSSSDRTSHLAAGRPRRRASAFTLVELLVTIFIIALLIGILLPRLSSARSQAKRTVCMSQQRTIALALIAYANQNRDRLPPTGPVVEGVSPRELLSRGNSEPVNLGWLIGDTLPDSDSLFCPSAQRANFDRDGDVLVKGGVAACDYTYGVSISPCTPQSIGSLRSTAILADNFVGSEMGAGVGLGYFSHRTGYNVAFTDGSALFYDDPDNSIAEERIPYDYEDDPFNYYALEGGRRPSEAPLTMRIYEAWHAFSANVPDPF